MKLTKLHLIIILALALILCPILGVCSNMREGMVGGDEGGDTNNNNNLNDESVPL